MNEFSSFNIQKVFKMWNILKQIVLDIKFYPCF